MARVTLVTCDGCSTQVEGDDKARRHGWSRVTVSTDGFPDVMSHKAEWINSENEYDLCTACLERMVREINPLRWVRYEVGK